MTVRIYGLKTNQIEGSTYLMIDRPARWDNRFQYTSLYYCTQAEMRLAGSYVGSMHRLYNIDNGLRVGEAIAMNRFLTNNFIRNYNPSPDGFDINVKIDLARVLNDDVFNLIDHIIDFSPEYFEIEIPLPTPNQIQLYENGPDRRFLIGPSDE